MDQKSSYSGTCGLPPQVEVVPYMISWWRWDEVYRLGGRGGDLDLECLTTCVFVCFIDSGQKLSVVLINMNLRWHM